SLNLDHPPGLVQLGTQPLVVLTQPHILPIDPVGLRTSDRLGQGLQRALVALLTPRRDQRRVQAFPAQQRTLARLVQGLVLGQNPRLVRRRVRPRPRLRRNLRIRHLIDRTHERRTPYSPSATAFQSQALPHSTLAQRASAAGRSGTPRARRRRTGPRWSGRPRRAPTTPARTHPTHR